MTSKQADALARMQATNAALTPEQRKARSAKAAAASKAAMAAKKGAASTAGDPALSGGKATATTKARVAPEQAYTWRVLLLTDKGAAWVSVEAGGMQRACRAARKANGGAMVRGVVRGDVPTVPPLPAK